MNKVKLPDGTICFEEETKYVGGSETQLSYKYYDMDLKDLDVPADLARDYWRKVEDVEVLEVNISLGETLDYSNLIQKEDEKEMDLTASRKMKQLLVFCDLETNKWKYVVKSSNGIVIVMSKGYGSVGTAEKGLKSLATAFDSNVTKYYVQYKNLPFREPKEKDLK